MKTAVGETEGAETDGQGRAPALERPGTINCIVLTIRVQASSSLKKDSL